jgi:hypothetical protein
MSPRASFKNYVALPLRSRLVEEDHLRRAESAQFGLTPFCDFTRTPIGL